MSAWATPAALRALVFTTPEVQEHGTFTYAPGGRALSPGASRGGIGVRHNDTNRMFRIYLLLFLSVLLHGAEIPWQIADLKKTPQSWGASTAEPGVKAVWIAGPLYKGKPTRAFAYYGIPEGAQRLQAWS